jgi:hypothetical protein
MLSDTLGETPAEGLNGMPEMERSQETAFGVLLSVVADVVIGIVDSAKSTEATLLRVDAGILVLLSQVIIDVGHLRSLGDVRRSTLCHALLVDVFEATHEPLGNICLVVHHACIVALQGPISRP